MYPTRNVLITFLVLFLLAGCDRSSRKSAEVAASDSKRSDTVTAKSISSFAAEDALREASLSGDLAQVKDLLNKGTSINAPDQDGHTSLMLAAFNGHSEIVISLLEGGALVDQRDLMGRTALLYASTGPFQETVKILLDRGAQPNIVDSDEHFSPLMHAAAEGNLDVVKVLLDYKADPSLTDVDGDDAESFARQAGHTEVADYLKSIR
jgi:ankyrin repeat protein